MIEYVYRLAMSSGAARGRDRNRRRRCQGGVRGIWRRGRDDLEGSSFGHRPHSRTGAAPGLGGRIDRRQRAGRRAAVAAGADRPGRGPAGGQRQRPTSRRCATPITSIESYLDPNIVKVVALANTRFISAARRFPGIATRRPQGSRGQQRPSRAHGGTSASMPIGSVRCGAWRRRRHRNSSGGNGSNNCGRWSLA